MTAPISVQAILFYKKSRVVLYEHYAVLKKEVGFMPGEGSARLGYEVGMSIEMRNGRWLSGKVYVEGALPCGGTENAVKETIHTRLAPLLTDAIDIEVARVLERIKEVDAAL